MSPEIVARYTAAFARFCGPGAIIVGRDGRPSGQWVEDVVVGALRACGNDVRVIGVAPTPTVQLAVEHSDAVGGISITASHNPSQWNGLKFLTAEGIFLDGEECARLFEIVDTAGPELAAWDASGGRTDAADAIAKHQELTLGLPFVMVEALREREFKVVVDAVNAAGSEIVPRLLEHCGCDVIRLYCDGSGHFPHTPEPLPENLKALAFSVAEARADLGIAVDPDADRLVLIDETGTPFGEEYTITQAADFILRWERARNPERELLAVVNLSTTRAVEDVAARYGARVERTPVGEINVARAMKENGAVIGGEGSGGVILPALHYGRDSLAGIIITLQNLLEHGGTLSTLRRDLPGYEIVKKKGELPEGVGAKELLERIARQESAGARVTVTDGVKLDYESSWVHLRASNTEPIVRVIAEAKSREEAENLADRFLRMLTGA
jgi:phosphomannomutase